MLLFTFPCYLQAVGLPTTVKLSSILFVSSGGDTFLVSGPRAHGLTAAWLAMFLTLRFDVLLLAVWLLNP